MVRLASRVVVGVFTGQADAARAVDTLRTDGLEPERVSLLLRLRPQPGESSASVEMGQEAAPAGQRRLAGALGLAAGRLGRVVVGDVAGLGPVAGAGALVAGLDVQAEGDLTAVLESAGFSQREARTHAAHVRDGRVLVLAAVPDRLAAEHVRATFTRSGAVEVAYFAGKPYGTAFHGAGPGA